MPLTGQSCSTVLKGRYGYIAHVQTNRFQLQRVLRRDRMRRSVQDGPAWDFIRKHAVNGIDVPSIAATIGVSTRLLQRSYRTVTGHTVLEDLQNEKLERVKSLLRETSTPIDAIGPICDFKSIAHLKTLFKKKLGMTMSQYRFSCE